MLDVPAPSLSSDVHCLHLDHHGWLPGWLRGRPGGSHHAADLAQDTFVPILGRGEQAVQPREPRAYLSTIARGLVIDFHRRRVLEQAWHPSPVDAPPASALASAVTSQDTRKAAPVLRRAGQRRRGVPRAAVGGLVGASALCLSCLYVDERARRQSIPTALRWAMPGSFRC